jgi:hypothetical protein
MIWLKRTILLISIPVLLGALPAWQPAAAQQPTVDQRFGAVESFWAADEAADLGVGWERILFYWNEIQPFGPDSWNTLHVMEEWLHEANAHDRTVVGVLKNTPLWATDSPYASGVPRGLYLPDDDPNNLWANYVRRVAQYYAPLGVHNWIVWNEPDIAPGTYGHEFSGTMADYYQLLKVAYRVIKAEDPRATIHLGGMTYWHDPGYLGRFLNMVAADPTAPANNYYFDVISLHVYFRPETMQLIVGSAYAAQQAAGISPMKPVWVNETNARPSLDPEWPVAVESFTVDLDQQGWFIIQAFALGFAAGAERISVYKLVDVNLEAGGESWGIIRPHDFSKRPAYDAYDTLIKQTAGFVPPVRRQQDENYFVVAFQRPQGLTRILWSRVETPLGIELPALADTARLITATGQEYALTAQNGVYQVGLEGARCYEECYMGGAPVFVVEDGVTIERLPLAPPATFWPTPTPKPPATATPTPKLIATATGTTATATPTPEATATETAVPSATASATPMAVEAVEVETAVVSNQLSGWYFLGSGLLLGLGLLLFIRRRQ